MIVLFYPTFYAKTSRRQSYISLLGGTWSPAVFLFVKRAAINDLSRIG